MTRTLAHVSLALALPAVVLTGCLTEPDAELGTTAQAASKCPSWGCGENSPVMGPWEFHELDEAGSPNSVGVRVIDLVKNGVSYHPDVIGDQLYGRKVGMPVLTGAGLIGAYFQVATSDGATYQIQIKNVSNVTTFWLGPQETIETYELLYYRPRYMTRPEPLCKNPPSRWDGENRPWPRTLEAILYTGDRYDADSKEVTADSYSEAGTWFNIGCAGSALAKLHLNRHTTAAMTSSYATGWMQRQALLKMYVSDVCGTGEAFTKQGTPLHWTNAWQWVSLVGNESSYEGLWDHDGAICIDHHRLEADPEFADGIKASCPNLPKCTAIIPGFPNVWAPGAYLLTANP